jgi:isopentenyl diphosphate isomerase/L-lactate dehydrogenase-like FMN-dependent dehydrogenase
VAEAAAKHEIPYVLSGFATFTIEELARVGGSQLWFEVGPMADVELRSSFIERAKKCDYQVLLYMADCPVGGRRERELKAGLGFPPRYSAQNILDGFLHPRWGLGWLKSAHNVAPRNIEGAGGKRTLLPKVPPVAPFGARISSPAGTWDDFRQVGEEWGGIYGAKGIITAADAERAVENGANLIVVSNHGGRQLDGLPGTVDVLPEIVAAVGGQAEVLVDGGVRRGTHVAKCVSLGAQACLIGRPYHYGLGAGGCQGVDRVIGMLKDELDRTMALLGRTSIDQLGPDCLRTASH